jgi:hypothetical protein
MLKLIIFVALSACITLATVPATAGGWGKSGHGQVSSGGLLKLSPSIQTGNLNLLSGIGILKNTSLLSGNVLSGFVKGSNNNVGNGNVSGRQNAVGNGFVGGGSFGNSFTKITQSAKHGRR